MPDLKSIDDVKIVKRGAGRPRKLSDDVKKVKRGRGRPRILSDEDKKMYFKIRCATDYKCVCGSSVKLVNKSHHEKTIKHRLILKCIELEKENNKLKCIGLENENNKTD